MIFIKVINKHEKVNDKSKNVMNKFVKVID